MSTPEYTIQGRTVSIPVEVRDARSWFATFAVPLDAATSLIDYSGLVPASPIPGRALCSLAFVDYTDGDLDPYHEVAVAILVREPGTTSRRPAGAFIHQLPVDQSFTCEAGRTIWGFPKFIAEVDIVAGSRGAARATLIHDGEHVLTLHIGSGAPVPSRGTALDAFSHRDGVLRRTRWSLNGTGSRMRPGGARVELGDHPIAKELRGLGLPRRALMSGSLTHVRMEFAAAEVV
ncbi:MAG: acetoacetate decarboxylase family protein [Acidimicrobiia bacterium]